MQGRQRRPIQALTILQPWAELIVRGSKRVENRKWAPPGSLVGAFLAVHAGTTRNRRERVDAWGGAIEHARALGTLASLPLLSKLTEIPAGGPRFKFAAQDHYIDTAVPYGAIVGVAVVDRVVRNRVDLPAEQHAWWAGPVGWVLRDVVAIEPVPCKGAQGLWGLPENVLALVRERYGAAQGRAVPRG
jgi:hypothetical protein